MSHGMLKQPKYLCRYHTKIKMTGGGGGPVNPFYRIISNRRARLLDSGLGLISLKVGGSSIGGALLLEIIR